jgi:isopentenyl-diphosphate delta-isomerase
MNPAATPVVLVDDQDLPIGTGIKSEVHGLSPVRHRAFSLFVVRPDGRVLLQKRSGQKPLWPHHWANACCSHPMPTETIEEAACRRAREELGLLISKPATLFKFEYQAQYLDVGAEHELCHVLLAYVGSPILHACPAELDGHEWLTPPEIDAAITSGNRPFAPWFLLEWPRVSAALQRKAAA